MTWVLKQTTTNTYEVNIEELDKLYCGTISSEHLQDILALGGGNMARHAEIWIGEVFDLHDGSVYGDTLFSDRADQDTGMELLWEEDYESD